MRFVALDVETSNANLASICQVGLCVFEGGKLVETYETLINPEDYFSDVNTKIHGITREMVLSSPLFIDIEDKLKNYLNNNTIIHHSAFDKSAINQVCEKYEIENFSCKWLDTTKVVRRAWPEQFAQRGYGLNNIANHLGIKFNHHDALEDAKTTGEIFLRILNETNTNLEYWLERVNKSISGLSSSSVIKETANEDGDLYGEVVVFTGALSIPRRQAAKMASQAGCEVCSGVNKRTTLLVVGDVDILRTAGKDKSSKQIKAEKLIGEGQEIRILSESDFEIIVLTNQGNVDEQ